MFYSPKEAYDAVNPEVAYRPLSGGDDHQPQDTVEKTAGGGLEDNSEVNIEPTQETASLPHVPDPTLWGVLEPIGDDRPVISLEEATYKYILGRNPPKTAPEGVARVVLQGNVSLSWVHCEIVRAIDAQGNSTVYITDRSRNGTFVNGQNLTKDCSRLLNDGNEIALGACDYYKYVYRSYEMFEPKDSELERKYDLVRHLGRGAFGYVIKALRKARSSTRNSWCAIKIIAADKLRKEYGLSAIALNSSDQNEVEENVIAREIAVMKRLAHHPYICQLEDFLLEDYGLALVLEYVGGGDLETYMHTHHDHEPMDEHKAQYLTYQICDALAYIHEQGIAHRDLKPENILLTDAKPPKVKVADFGLARVVSDGELMRTVCGTPKYIAPEVAARRNGKGYSTLVDSWSVGVIV